MAVKESIESHMWNGQWDGVVELWPSPGPALGSDEMPVLQAGGAELDGPAVYGCKSK